MIKLAKRHKSKKTDDAIELDGISRTRIAIAVGVLVVLILILIFYKDIMPKKNKVVALINGEQITEEELDNLYSKVPELYKTNGLTKDKFLFDTLIPQKLLLQEAARIGVTATEEEVNGLISNIREMNGLSEDEFNEQLKQQNLTSEEFRKLTEEQILITKLLNVTIPSINITDSEAKEFYDSNKELFSTGNSTYIKLSEVEDRIKAYLANKRFLEELRSNADIQILSGDYSAGSLTAGSQDSATEGQEGSTFRATSEPVCKEDGKPIIRLYSTTWCPHCKWIKDTYGSVVEEYAGQGKIKAYHWQLDTNDDELTPDEEGSIPDSELSMFNKYSPNRGVPLFVFGCKYIRMGNGYETEDDLSAEENEFRQIIDSLINEK